MGHYVMVGLASRRILLHHTTDHMVAQVLRLQQPHGGETSMRVSLANVNPWEFHGTTKYYAIFICAFINAS